MNSEPSVETKPAASHRDLWNTILEEFQTKRRDVEEYIQSKSTVVPPPPHREVDYLNDTVFPTLNKSLIKILLKVKEQERLVFTEGDEYLNSLNFVAECLWNLNPLHPERRKRWVRADDIVWSNVYKSLKNTIPR